MSKIKIMPDDTLHILMVCIALITFGFFIGLWVYVYVDTTPRREANFPSKCRPGEQIIYTSAPKFELYVCESHWVRH